VYKQNLMRMLGGVILITIPIISLMLLLPHQVHIQYGMVFIFLFLILVVNSVTVLLPFRESLLNRHFDLLMSLYSVILISLVCVTIHFSGGVRSPMFVLLLLVTAFSTSLFSSLTSSILLSAFSVGAYLVTLLVFSSLHRVDIQLICAQIFFLLLFAYFINRLGAESREQVQEKAKAMEELRILSEMDRAASGFVSAVSFEMRTPLTSILGFSDMLVNKEWEAEKEQQYIEIISREADNLSHLVEDLLDISRLESGKVNLNKEATSLDQLLNMSLPILEPACDPSQVVMNISPNLPEIIVDAQLMKRVFDAVFGYVVRKSGRGSEVRASAKTEGREVVVTFNIRNRGAAARQEDGSRIFPPLGGQDEEDLELAMARRIILAHKGSLNLIQASGGWFAIVVRLPELVARDYIKT
jgi:signal transduction histidine kinase